MTLPDEEEKDDVAASSSGAEQPVPAKKAKKTPAKKTRARKSKDAASSQSENEATEMEPPASTVSAILIKNRGSRLFQIVPKSRRSKRTRRHNSQESQA